MDGQDEAMARGGAGLPSNTIAQPGRTQHFQGTAEDSAEVAQPEDSTAQTEIQIGTTSRSIGLDD